MELRLALNVHEHSDPHVLVDGQPLCGTPARLSRLADDPDYFRQQVDRGHLCRRCQRSQRFESVRYLSR